MTLPPLYNKSRSDCPNCTEETGNVYYLLRDRVLMKLTTKSELEAKITLDSLFKYVRALTRIRSQVIGRPIRFHQ